MRLFFNHFILINLFWWESYIFHAGNVCVVVFFFVLRKVGVSRHLEFDWSKKKGVYIIGRVEWLSQNLAEENIDKMFKPHRQHCIYVKKKKCVLFILFIYHLDWYQTDCLFLHFFYIFEIIYFSCASSGHLFLNLIKFVWFKGFHLGAKGIDLVWLRFLLHKFFFIPCKVRIEYRRYFWYLVGSFCKNQFYSGNKDFRAVMSRYLWNLKIKLFAFTYFISCIKLTLASLFWQVSIEQKEFSKNLLHAKKL